MSVCPALKGSVNQTTTRYARSAKECTHWEARDAMLAQQLD